MTITILAALTALSLFGASAATAQGFINWSAAMTPEFHNFLASPGPAQCQWYERILRFCLEAAVPEMNPSPRGFGISRLPAESI